jgi:hypothetical protein
MLAGEPVSIRDDAPFGITAKMSTGGMAVAIWDLFIAVHSCGIDGMVCMKNSGTTSALRRHDVSLAAPTVIMSVVPPEANLVTSLITAKKVEFLGYERGNVTEIPSIVKSRITRTSGLSWPVGTRRRRKGA